VPGAGAGPPVRVPPLGPGERGPLARAAAAVAARATGGEAPHVVTTLARHRRLFRRWLPFATGLLRGGLPAEDRELVVLRTAWRCRSWYEWAHHATLATAAGLAPEDVARVADGPSAAGWSGRQRALLRAVDEMHEGRVVTDGTWAALAAELPADGLVELCLLVGHYEMLAMALNSLGTAPEPATLARLRDADRALAGELRDDLAHRRRGRRAT
jgi:alkylhydroperoxidase family enzyme